jgi:hypothetical protein
MLGFVPLARKAKIAFFITFREGARVGNWLVARFTLFGVTFQNWMTVALVIVLIGMLIAWRSQQ